MLYILNKYVDNNVQVAEYTKDGTTVSHTVKTPIQTEPSEPQEPEPTINESILFENQYQTAMLEILSLGGM